jgi:hypothetical protein
MPTKQPRVTVTLKPSTHAVLARLSILSKSSQSSIVGQLLESAEPVFERTCRVIEAANKVQGSMREQVVQNLELAEAAIGKQMGLAIGDIETRSSDLVDDLESISRRRLRSAAGARSALPRKRSRPPASNRGGATTQTRERKAMRRGAR